MDLYNADLAIEPFGLQNIGASCHFNSLMQAIVSCTAVITAVNKNEKYLSQTKTGQSFYKFMTSNDKTLLSGELLMAFISDLRVRRPGFKFGNSQESASEGLVLLLDMLSPPDEKEGINPIARLFYNRFRAEIHCSSCFESKTSIKDKKPGIVSSEHDMSVQINLFHMDKLNTQPKMPSEFSTMIRTHISKLDDYKCELCGKNGNAFRIYKLCMAPEIIVCLYNLYTVHRYIRYFPQQFSLPGVDDKQVVYRQVAQVEQSGSLHGGHYIARSLRADNKVYQISDSSYSGSTFNSNPNVYMVFYHVE